MNLSLPVFYALLFVIVIWRMPLFGDERLPRIFFIAVFSAKVLLALFYTKIFSGGDTTTYFDDASVIIYPSLLRTPLKYIYLTLGPNGGAIPEFIRPEVLAMGYWGDTSDYMVVRFNALLCIFSFGNFYVHGVFMAFLSLIGLMWLYRSCLKSTGIYSPIVAGALFLIPSVLFWGSGVHKEGMLLFSLGLFFYGGVRLAQKFTVKNLLIFLAGTTLTYLIRDHVLFILLPGMLAYFITLKNYVRIRFIVPVIYLAVIAAGITLPLFGGKNFPEVISEKQKEFKALEAGSTQIKVKDFKPSFLCLFTNLPQALRNTLLGPFFISPTKTVHYLAIAENVFLVLAVIAFPWITGRPRLEPFSLMCLLFSVSLLILIGYIVPNVGAIVRYRSIALPFLFLFLYSGRKDFFHIRK
ncbi:MAG TPA: hypothetical protein VNJ07_12475 [Chitinophagales bacterium]|nr:hypothetical protein [Chitinophagales bacterium]